MPTFNPDMLRIARDLRGMSQTELVQKWEILLKLLYPKLRKVTLSLQMKQSLILLRPLISQKGSFHQDDHFKVSPISLHAYRKSFNYS